jgi:cell division initiation protein
MKVTPLEIRQKTFEKGFRGYEKDEVEAYLLSLSVEWDKMLEENREMKIKTDQLTKEVQKMREVESSLYKTLKTAEDTGSHLVDQASKTAELMLKEAQMNSDAIINDAKYNAKNIVEEAEVRAKNIAEEARDEVKIALREVKEVENMKENLLIEIKGVASEMIERVNKINAKTKRYAISDKNQDIPLFVSSQTPTIDITERQKNDTEGIPTRASKGSFFDNI